jgi:hypothetical protein
VFCLEDQPDSKFEKKIDTKILAQEIYEFIKKHKITREYFSKTVLAISRSYFIEIIEYPISWNKLIKSGKKPYEKMNEFLNNTTQVHEFLLQYEMMCESNRIQESNKKCGKLPIKYSNHNSNIDININDNVSPRNYNQDECINIKVEIEEGIEGYYEYD